MVSDGSRAGGGVKTVLTRFRSLYCGGSEGADRWDWRGGKGVKNQLVSCLAHKQR